MLWFEKISRRGGGDDQNQNILRKFGCFKLGLKKSSFHVSKNTGGGPSKPKLIKFFYMMASLTVFYQR